MLRVLILIAGIFATAACGGSGPVVETAETPAEADVWMAPDSAFEFVLPEGWLVIEATKLDDYPAYQAYIRHNSTPENTAPTCRLIIVDLRRLPDVFSADQSLSNAEVAQEVSEFIADLKEEHMSVEGQRNSARNGEYPSAFEGVEWRYVPSSFRISRTLDSELVSNWQAEWSIADRQKGTVFFTSDRTFTKAGMSDRTCSYFTYAEWTQRISGDIASLRAAMDF